MVRRKKKNPIYTEEDEQRMDIIGQNGNDGLHYEEEENDNEVSVDKGLLRKIIGQQKVNSHLVVETNPKWITLEKKYKKVLTCTGFSLLALGVK